MSDEPPIGAETLAVSAERERHRLYVQGSMARGLAIVALVVLSLTLLRALAQRGSAAGSKEPVCLSPVQIGEGGQQRLSCADGVELGSCGPLSAGDRVQLSADGCALDPRGMDSATRLMLGLKLDLNRSSAESLQLLRGIGPATSRAIVAHREAVGAFEALEDLLDVKGIGPATLEKLRVFVEIRAP